MAIKFIGTHKQFRPVPKDGYDQRVIGTVHDHSVSSSVQPNEQGPTVFLGLEATMEYSNGEGEETKQVVPDLKPDGQPHVVGKTFLDVISGFLIKARVRRFR